METNAPAAPNAFTIDFEDGASTAFGHLVDAQYEQKGVIFYGFDFNYLDGISSANWVPARSGNWIVRAGAGMSLGQAYVRFTRPMRVVSTYVNATHKTVMTCYSAKGQILGRDSLPETRSPYHGGLIGNYPSQWSTTPPHYPLRVEAPGIQRCTFTQPSSWNGISAGFDDFSFVPDDAGTMILTCNGARDSVRVVRADSLSCTPVTEPVGQAVDSLRWEFQGPNGVTVNGPAGDPTWGGTIVAEGTVIATGRVNGQAVADSLVIRVQPRTWQQITPVAADSGHGNLPDPPGEYGHLGQTRAPRLLDPLPVDSIISGPNEGWYYLRAQIARVEVPIYISRAFQAGHPWRESQHHQLKSNSVSGAIYWCAKNKVPQLERVTRQHEGLISGLRSHMDAIREYFRDEDPEIKLEAMTPHRSMGTYRHEFNLMFHELIGNAAVRHPRAQHTPGLPGGHPQGTVPLPSFSCEMRF